MVTCFFQTRQGEILEATNENKALLGRMPRDGELSHPLAFPQDPASLINRVVFR
jgi:hypothetical protein